MSLHSLDAVLFEMPESPIAWTSSSCRDPYMPTKWHGDMSSVRVVAATGPPVQSLLREPVVHHLLSDVLRGAAVHARPALDLLSRLGWYKEAERDETLPRGWHLAPPLTTLPGSRGRLCSSRRCSGWCRQRSFIQRDPGARLQSHAYTS